MSNLAEMERHRLRLYGEMLKNDLTERRNHEKIQKQALLKRDSMDLERHIQNTRKMDLSKRLEIKELNNALKEDNMMLSTLKKSMNFGKTYAEQGQNFINEIHQMDNKRLNRLKNDLAQQFHDNRDFTSNKRVIEEKIKEIEKLETERHSNRIKEMQMESVKSYENIKRKHQQDMQLFEKHKKLVEENQNYRDQIESFTQVRGGMLDRFNRNQYLQRRASLRQNQDEIVKQMEQFQRRKHQDSVEYKKKVGNLQESMLASILSKPPRYEPKAYSSELRHQMQEDTMRRFEETSAKKEKIELNNIYGGVHGNQREKMIRIIDKGLGIDRYSQQSLATSSKKPDLHIQHQINAQNNPQLRLSESQRYPTPKNNERLNNSQQIHTNPAVEHPQQSAIRDFSASQVSNNSSQNRRYFKSYDLITGKNRYYGAQ